MKCECERCHTTYDRKSNNQKYCSSCAAKIRAAKKSMYNKNYYNKNHKQHKKSKCKQCGKEFLIVKPNQHYCSTECSSYAKLEHNKINNRVYYSKWKTIIYSRGVNKIGGFLGANRSPDFQHEERLIKNEMKRLGLKS